MMPGAAADVVDDSEQAQEAADAGVEDGGTERPVERDG